MIVGVDYKKTGKEKIFSFKLSQERYMDQLDYNKQLSFSTVRKASNGINHSTVGQNNLRLRCIHLLALSKIRGIGFHTLRKVMEEYPTLDTIWHVSEIELHSLAPRHSKEKISEISRILREEKDDLLEKGQKELEALERKGINLLLALDPLFPKSLRNISDYPYWVFVQGNIRLLSQNDLVAVVGTRSPTEQGLAYARRISIILSKNGFPIVSGLAEGIDKIAHETATDLGNKCVAVLGTGISVVFPATTAHLRARILECNGAILSEYLPDDLYSKSNFVQRNRLQAALSRVVIPVEWSVSGGTARTIQFAEKYRRPVLFIDEHKKIGSKSKTVLYTQPEYRFILDMQSLNVENDLLTILKELGIEPNEKSSYSGNDLFKNLKQEFSRILENYQVSRSDLDELLEELAERWLYKTEQEE